MVYKYNERRPELIKLEDLSERQKYLLIESNKFCMLPWVHLHAFPTGQAYTCCLAELRHPVGNLRNQTLEEVWNSDDMKQTRISMLEEKETKACARCYEQEDMGFFSMRNSSNKRFGHHINKIDQTNLDGSMDKMELVYWDIRFSNLCNLRCRTCGNIFSSNWYDDQAKLIELESGEQAAKNWKENTRRVEYAGRTQLDAWEQLEPHLEYVEQIYFAGGEPLIMEEHYRILKTLIAKGKTNVRLIYNTNFSELRYKKDNVLPMWNEFESVCIGASLDAMGPLAELMRKGTDWAQVERNREEMLKICPQVDFYISPTLCVMNVWQLPEFHRAWVDRGFLKPQDLNVNILQDPAHYRIDILPNSAKEEIKAQYEEHIAWLKPQDHLTRATIGFESAIKFMTSDDKTNLIPKFWHKTAQLDKIRNEDLLSIVPQLQVLK